MTTEMEKRMQKLRNQQYILNGLLIILSIVVYLYPLGLPIKVSEHTKIAYEAIENLPPGSRVVLATDVAPGWYAELGYTCEAVIEHLFKKDIQFVAVTFSVDAGPSFLTVMSNVVVPSDKKYGEDWVYVGFIAGDATAQYSFASDFQGLIQTDYYGTPREQIQMLDGIETLNDFDLAFIFGSHPDSYILHWITPFDIYTLTATAALYQPTMLAYYPDAFKAVMNSMRGAGEYELLTNRKTGIAIKSMDLISSIHYLIIASIILGNVYYYYKGREV